MFDMPEKRGWMDGWMDKTQLGRQSAGRTAAKLLCTQSKFDSRYTWFFLWFHEKEIGPNDRAPGMDCGCATSRKA